MNKRKLRNLIKNKRMNMSLDDVNIKSEIIESSILGLKEVLNSNVIMLYIDFNNEVKTLKLIQKLINKGKTIVVPYIDCEDHIQVVKIDNVYEGLIPGKFGVLEPEDKSKTVSYKELDTVIVPGIVFDMEGNRIGFGGGYYDRFLETLMKHNSNAVFIGICYDFQVAEKIIKEDHDIIMNMIVTDKKTLHINK